MTAWLDGGPADPRLAEARGLHYGDGVFRTLRVHRGELVDAAGQLAHLAADARALALHAPQEVLAAEAGQLLQTAALADGALKILLWRKASGRGYRPQGGDCHRLLSLHPLPVLRLDPATAGARVDLAALRLGEQPALAGIKHLNRLEQVLASRDWPAAIDERLLANDQDELICGTRSNLFAVSEGRLWTPRLDRAGVAGRTRARVLALAEAAGIAVQIAPLPVAALSSVQELFLSNSLFGLWGVAEAPGFRASGPGPLTRRLLQTLAHPPWKAAAC